MDEIDGESGKVVDLAPRRILRDMQKASIAMDLASGPDQNVAHLAGEAICLGCRHEWVAVAPVGAHHFECPECSCAKGVLKRWVYRQDCPVWVCEQCKNEFWLLTAEGPMCPGCGAFASDYDGPNLPPPPDPKPQPPRAA